MSCAVEDSCGDGLFGDLLVVLVAGNNLEDARMKARNSLLALVMLALSVVPGSAGPQPPAGWTDGYVVANGIRIHYWRTGGNKPALVMAHGSSDDALCWTNLAREFQDRYDIVMFDARGHGLSDP